METSCPICNSENIKIVKQKSRDGDVLDTGHCINCNHFFLLSEYNDIYTSGEFSIIARNQSNEPDSKKIKSLEIKAYERIEFYKDFITKNDNFLEAGSSIGSFLHYLKIFGKKAEGLEPDKDYCNFSEKIYKFTQYNNLLEEFNSEKKYDTICSFHVIEHVKDPETFINKIHKLLDINGKVLIECPSYEIHTFGDMEKTVWKPHQHYFSAPSLYKLLSPYFKVIKIGYYQANIFVIGEKKDKPQFNEKDFLKHKKRARRLFSLNSKFPKFSKKLPLNQIIIQSLYQKGKFKYLRKKGRNYTRYKLKEKQFLNNERGKGNNKIYHITNFKGWGNNAGDIILSKCVRDVFKSEHSIQFNINEVSKVPTRNDIKEINKNKLLLIGGGGLFLPDTNKNNLSGWQWAVSEELLNEINVPVVLYAVGYNYFRGQQPSNFFIKNLHNILEKSNYTGIRNYGSINKINELTNNKFTDKISYQPCPTTIIRELYKNLPKKETSKSVAVNMAFDRPLLRFGTDYEHILNSVAKSLKHLENEGYKIYNTTHITADKRFEIVLERNNVNFKTVELQYLFPKDVFKFYNSMELVMGMRGHAQMIPFGLNTKILTLGSHDKMYWFLKDLNALEWYVELNNNRDIFEDINSKVTDILINKSKETKLKLIQEQKRLYDITKINIETILKDFT